jgi:prolyl-tRNA editing enzyme YbaK/EbsC (Cys-tRNA(Pro) deacylase)
MTDGQKRRIAMKIITPITKLLDAEGVPCKELPHSEPVYTIETAAAQRGVVRDEMVKAILLREATGDRRYVMACTLGDDRVDPKRVREALGGDWRRLTFASAEEIRAVSAGEKGAVAPLALPPDVPVIFDVAIAGKTTVNISSGHILLGLELPAADLIRLSGARFAAVREVESSW